jgi:3-oxoacyl-[acyl-carrier-protein] synthase II
MSGRPHLPHRAVVTGIGLVSSEGVGMAAWDAALTGGASEPSAGARRVAARLPEEKAIPPKALRKISDQSRLVTIAVDALLRDVADAGSSAIERDDLGVLVGTSFGCSSYHLEYHEGLRRKGITGVSALLFTQSVFNAAGGHVGQVYGLRGSNLTFVGGEVVGLEAIARAGLRVRAGVDRALLAGGADQFDAMVQRSLDAAGHLRDGLGDGVFTEGAAMALVERAEDAAARGVTPWAEIAGSAHARRGPLRDLFERAVAGACSRAGLARDAIDLVVVCPPSAGEAAAHVEAAASTCPDAALAVPTSGIGEGFAFSSAAAFATAASAVREGRIPATPRTAALEASGLAALVDDRAARANGRRPERVLVLSSTPHQNVAAVLLRRVGSS